MPLIHFRRLPVVYPLPNNIPHTFSWPLSSVLEHRDCQSNAKEYGYHVFAVKKISLNPCVRSLRLPSAEALQISVAVGETSSICNSNVGIEAFVKQALNEEPQMLGNSVDSPTKKDRKKRQRRKIEHGNKGKVPWNKGRKHSAETRVRIKQRTIEALSDPKVREKMSTCPRPHSAQTKARIQSSLRRVWAKRLKWKQLREKLYHSWLESIANCAKKGGNDQKELDWDSYDKIKQKIAIQQLRWAEDKARAKEILKRRRERAAQARVEKMARTAQWRKEREEKAKQKREQKRKRHKQSNIDEEKSAVIKGMKLKQKLTKIHKRKIINGQVTIRGDAMISHIAAGDKLDIELVKREKLRREVSLAEQIQAAKSKRAQSTAVESLMASSTIRPSSENHT